MIVVTGATGNVGTTLVRTLAAAGEKVAAVSRTVTALPPGVVHHVADLGDVASLAPAFDGADALFLLLPGQMHHLDATEILAAATTRGVRRVVLLSSQGVETRPGHAPLGVFEEAVKASGLDWTILRPGGFDSNAYLWAQTIRTDRLVAAPFGDVGLPIVDPDDIAAVAAAALLDPAHHGRTYVLTGPSAITPRQQATAFAEALDEPVRFVELDRAEAHAAMARFMPEPAIEPTLSILGEPTAYEQRVSHDIEKVLGRASGDFASWVERNVAAFR